jgi:predicted nucleotidyltransferase
MATVEKVSIALSNDLLRAVRSAVAQGEYASTSEVVREALREWRTRRPALSAPRQVSVESVLATQGAALQALCEQFQVRRLGMFGSATRADFDPQSSDIDLAVEFIADAELSAREFFALQASLAALFQRPVDLVELAVMPTSRLKRVIERTQQPIYERAAPG